MKSIYSACLGYIDSRFACLSGEIVVYDRKKGFEIDAEERWIVMHEPSSRHIAIHTKAHAIDLMKSLANCISIDEAAYHADGIFNN